MTARTTDPCRRCRTAPRRAGGMSYCAPCAVESERDSKRESNRRARARAAEEAAARRQGDRWFDDNGVELAFAVGALQERLLTFASHYDTRTEAFSVLAGRMGRKPSYVSQLERIANGRNRWVSLFVADEICLALGTSLDAVWYSPAKVAA